MQEHETILRRHFLGSAAATAASASLLGAGLALAADSPTPPPAKRKIKVGLVGCGGRGSWIAGLFHQHGGYQFVAAADYFQDRADKTGASLGVDKSKCFSGLSAYKRLIASGVEAVILETPPYFFPEHAEAAVEAGLHVYMAKPVAVDVPGALKIGALGKKATREQRVFLVDYQMWTDPLNLEVYKRIREGGLGKLANGLLGGHQRRRRLRRSAPDRQPGKPPDEPDLGQRRRAGLRLHRQLSTSTSSTPSSGPWASGPSPPTARADASARTPTAIPSTPTSSPTPSPTAWPGITKAPPARPTTGSNRALWKARSRAATAAARLAYWGKAYLRGGPKHFGGGPVDNLYEAGASATSPPSTRDVLGGNFGNQTAQRSVDCTLTCILGREAARRGALLTMDEVIKENQRLEIDTKGLKA